MPEFVTVFLILRPRPSNSACWMVMSVSFSVALTSRFPLTRGVVRAVIQYTMAGSAYILHCADGRFYYGSTNNLLRRLAQHRTGKVKSTKWRLPVELVYFVECETLEEARQKERSFKNGRTRRKTIELLIKQFPRERLAPFA
jgi:putative endonuclease